MSDKAILALQVGGFVLAVIMLAILGHRDPFLSVAFSWAFGVHLVGDLFRLKKDGVI